MDKRIFVLLGLSLFLSFISLAISPYVSSTPPSGQYHTLNELWINESVIDWKGLDFTGINTLHVKTICLDEYCKAKIYWNGSALIIEAPNIVVARTS